STESVGDRGQACKEGTGNDPGRTPSAASPLNIRREAKREEPRPPGWQPGLSFSVLASDQPRRRLISARVSGSASGIVAAPSPSSKPKASEAACSASSSFFEP